jgi:hypothetical protein
MPSVELPLEIWLDILKLVSLRVLSILQTTNWFFRQAVHNEIERRARLGRQNKDSAVWMKVVERTRETESSRSGSKRTKFFRWKSSGGRDPGPGFFRSTPGARALHTVHKGKWGRCTGTLVHYQPLASGQRLVERLWAKAALGITSIILYFSRCR